MVRRLTVGLLAIATLAAATPAANADDVWSASSPPARVDVQATRLKAFTLDTAALKHQLADAPAVGLRSRSVARRSGAVLTLPAPDGGLQRFRVEETAVMEAGLAARHPEIKTYAGVGIDDPRATVRADLGPLGFHAFVRSGTRGDWFIDPAAVGETRVHVSYAGADVMNAVPFSESEPIGEVAKPAKRVSAEAEPDVVLRTYRLALANDPTYAESIGGTANVLAAKVAVVNRVNQIYQTEFSARLILIDGTDTLNLGTAAAATGANGPCGAAPCFTPAQLAICANDTIFRNRIVLGQLAGAANYDVGHVLLAVGGAGIAGNGVAGTTNKGWGCTGSTGTRGTQIVYLLAHELGHQFGLSHAFNGVLGSCSVANRSTPYAFEPGSGSSIMAYHTSCQRDALQAVNDLYFNGPGHESYATFVGRAIAPLSEVQTVSLRDFDGADSLTLGFGGATSVPVVRGTSYTTAGVQGAVQGNEVQTVSLSGYDAPGDSYTLSYQGASSVPIVRGQNDTTFGIQNALQGGNERQQVTLTGFNATTQSFRVQLGSGTSALLGSGGLALTAANVTTAINGIPGFAGTVTASETSATGFTVVFAGASTGVDVAALSIAGCGCGSTVREAAKGGVAVAGWPAGGTVGVGVVSDAGYTLSFLGTLLRADVALLELTNPSGTSGTVVETLKGSPGILPTGATVTVAGFGGAASPDDTGFQLTFGGTFAGQPVAPLELAVTGGSGFVGETARGGPARNAGFLVTPTGNHSPAFVAEEEEYGEWSIPTRTPFSLTALATDADGDPLTYLWDGYERGAAPGTALLSNLKPNGPLFRIFGSASTAVHSFTSHASPPGANHPDGNPTRVFPDMEQILAGNTNAATGTCPEAPPEPAVVPRAIVECYAEFLPTSDWRSVDPPFTDNATPFVREYAFTSTVRDGRPDGAGVTLHQFVVKIDTTAGPFRVTSQSIPQSAYAGSAQAIAWDPAGTNRAPIGIENVKISLSTDGGRTFGHVLAASTPNDGSQQVRLPDVAAATARIKVEAVGSVFFDVNHADFAIVPAPTGTVGGSVPATLSLTLGAPAAFGAFTPGVARDYLASTTATVISTAGDATLSVADPSSVAPGRLVNGGFALAQPLQVLTSGGAYTSLPAVTTTWAGPTSNENVTIGFKQPIAAIDPLRTGAYSKTLSFTLSTTTP